VTDLGALGRVSLPGSHNQDADAAYISTAFMIPFMASMLQTFAWLFHTLMPVPEIYQQCSIFKFKCTGWVSNDPQRSSSKYYQIRDEDEIHSNVEDISNSVLELEIDPCDPGGKMDWQERIFNHRVCVQEDGVDRSSDTMLHSASTDQSMLV